MMSNLKEEEPILFKNPHTGEYVNLQPLFYMLFMNSDGKPELFAENIEEVIRFVGVTFRAETFAYRLPDMLAHLYDVLDIFKNMSIKK